MATDELERAIQGYRRARAGEQARAAASTAGTLGAIRGGADVGTALQTGQAIRANQPTVAVGGTAGLTPQETLQAQLKMAEIEGKLNDTLAKTQGDLMKSQAERDQDKLDILADLVGTYGQLAGTGATAGATVQSARINQIGQTLNSQIERLGPDPTVSTPGDREAANLWIGTGFPELLRAGDPNAGASSADPTVFLRTNFLTSLANEVAQIEDPHAKMRFIDAVGAQVGFPLKDALFMEDIPGYAQNVGRVIDEGTILTVKPQLNMLKNSLGNAAAAIGQELSTRKAETDAAIASVGKLESLSGAGTNRQQAYLAGIIDSIMADDIEGAKEMLTVGIPKNEGLDAAKGSLGALPQATAPMTSAFDAKMAIMKSAEFQQQQAASGLDPEAYFTAKLRDVGARARQKLFSPAPEPPPAPAPAEPLPGAGPTKSGVNYDLNQFD